MQNHSRCAALACAILTITWGGSLARADEPTYDTGYLAPDAPRMTVPLLDKAPKLTMDGTPDEAVWNKAAVIGSFTNQGVLPDGRTVLRVMATADTIYLAADCYDPTMDKLRLKGTADGQGHLWEDDDLELFVARNPAELRDYTQMLLTAGGFKWIGRLKGAENAAPKSSLAVVRHDDRWSLEAAIDIAEANLPRPADGVVWRCNVGRDRKSSREVTSWSTLVMSLHNPFRMGLWQFSTDPARAGVAMTDLRQSGRILSGLYAGPADSRLFWVDGDREELLRTGPGEFEKTFPAELPLKTGRLVAKLGEEAIAATGSIMLDAPPRRPLGGKLPAPVMVYPTDGLQKVLPHHPPMPTGLEMTFHTARREWENAQIVLFARDRDLPGVRVSLGPLKNAAGETLDAKAKLYNVGMVASDFNSPGRLDGGVYPDPLTPHDPFTAPRGQASAVWVSLLTPADAKPGDYTGSATVQWQGGTISLPVKVTVYDVTLPVRHRLAAPFGVHVEPIMERFNVEPMSERFFELARAYAEACLEYRLDPGLMHRYWRHATAVAKLVFDGEDFEFDFTSFDKTIKEYRNRGLHSIAIGFHRSGILDTVGPDGKPVKQVPSGHGVGSLSPELRKKYEAAVRRYAGHLSQKGWFTDSYAYLVDEPGYGHIGPVGREASWLLGTDPAWRTMITTNRWDAPVDMKVGENFKIWCPDLRTFDPYWWGVWQKRTEQTWWYACYGQYRPSFLIDLRGVDTRMLFWLPKPLGLKGVLYWAVNDWGSENIRTAAHNGGDGYLFYPDEQGLPQPSVRAMIVRDGIDDYDLIDMLAEAQPGHPTLDFRDLARTPYQYSRDPRGLLARRVEILRALAGQDRP